MNLVGKGDSMRYVKEAAEAIRSHGVTDVSVGLVLGSGLGTLIQDMKDTVVIPFSKIPHFPISQVEGHQGAFVYGMLEGKPVLALSGRFHFYEGYSLDIVTLPIRIMKEFGVETLILTNACGAVNEAFRPGDLLLIRDHINLVGLDPLIGQNDASYGPRFPDATEIYSNRLRELATQKAKKLGMTLREGVYAWWSGPSYETPSEIKMIRVLGGDAIGMSTVPEALVANHMGMRILGISCLTNMASGILPQKLSHAEVLEVASRVNAAFRNLVKSIVSEL
jgi:purine-nucleoside phosphorylase